MALGAFMGVAFTVSDRKVLTPSGISGSGGGEWATHSSVGVKPRSQFVAPKLRKYQFELLLRAQDGVNPRSTLRHLRSMAEEGAADHFIIGGAPLSPFPFRITDITDEWDAVLHSGALAAVKVKLTVEEYV